MDEVGDKGECGNILFVFIHLKKTLTCYDLLCCRRCVTTEANERGGEDADANRSGGKNEGRGEGRGSRPAGKERGKVVLARGGASSS